MRHNKRHRSNKAVKWVQNPLTVPRLWCIHPKVEGRSAENAVTSGLWGSTTKVIEHNTPISLNPVVAGSSPAPFTILRH